jgi:hypothetical protein
MTYRVTRFKRWHLPILQQHGDSEGGFFIHDSMTLKCMEDAPNNWTMLYDDVPLLCGGTLEQWPGRHSSWAFLNKHSARHMVAVVREARRIIRRPKCRVDMTVRLDFLPGHKFAKMLGFRVETAIMDAYGPEGEPHIGYVFHPWFDEEKKTCQP